MADISFSLKTVSVYATDGQCRWSVSKGDVYVPYATYAPQRQTVFKRLLLPKWALLPKNIFHRQQNGHNRSMFKRFSNQSSDWR